MTSHVVEEWMVLEPHGRLYEGAECDEMERTLAVLSERRVRVVVDLGRAAELTAHGLGVLAHAQKIAADHGGRIALCGLSPVQRWLLARTGLSGVLTLHATRAAALRDLDRRPSTRSTGERTAPAARDRERAAEQRAS